MHWIREVFETTKYGGYVTIGALIIGAFVIWSAHPFMVDASGCVPHQIAPCQKVLDDGVLAADLFGLFLWGLLGVIVARVLMAFGVGKDTLGIKEEP
jgi:hypothetical protein